MSPRMLSAETWRDIGEVIVAVDGNPLAAIRALAFIGAMTLAGWWS